MNQQLTEINRLLLTSSALNLKPFIINLIVGILLGFLLRYCYRRFASTLSNRDELGNIFPIIVLTTILIIAVLKSSLAIAIGLVGALSIVRFRTPIKEPEELAYLFLCIAIGISLGAGQTIACIVGTIIILAMIISLKWMKRNKAETGLFIAIDCDDTGNNKGSDYLKKFNELILKHSINGDLRRFDERGNQLEILYYVNIANMELLTELTNEIRNTFTDVGISILDQKNVSGI